MGLLSILDANEREINRFRKIVEKINALENKITKLSDHDFPVKTQEFRSYIQKKLAGFPPETTESESKKALESVLQEILPEAFALVREASQRTTGLRHFDVQLMGGMVLHEGRIAEMKTGEGKTLVATLPLYLNALEGKGCHLVTVNDYLAKRDALWMGPIYLSLGLSVGVIQHGERLESYQLVMDDGTVSLSACSRKEAYLCDITYGTNNEFGFDYLRDNMVPHLEEMSQRELHYAIVDEVDSILVDEARTPLIISGIAEKPTDLYYKFARVIPRLSSEKDYAVDEKLHTATFTEEGLTKVEREIGVSNISDPENTPLFHHANCALRAHTLMKRDVDYVVKNGQVIIVDEFTGRLMYGRRYSEGLHQAIEAKEGVRIEHESQTLATVTFQNYFRMYNKLAGMTGTAKTEEQEFRKIYLLDVIVIPTDKTMIRCDCSDVIYRTEDGKFQAIVEEILECNKRGQPVLVGTRSIEKSEKISAILHGKGIVRVDWRKYPEEKIDQMTDVHFVLNAKEHEYEAKIISRAGRRGAVTIATNMAGRGVDIVLSPGVADVGGLHIIGTERHESRRIDNQLRGRSGRQGDPGSSRFYVSLEDELIRLFGGDRMKNIMDRVGFDDSMPIEHPWISKSIENAQKKVENHNFEIRRHVLDYDDVMEMQRKQIYTDRRKILEGADVKKNVLSMIEKSVHSLVDAYTSEHLAAEEWDMRGLKTDFRSLVPVGKGELNPELFENKAPSELKNSIFEFVSSVYEQRDRELGSETMRELERKVMLHVIDEKWIEHLDAMDYLREGINLRAYGQVDPLVAYKKEAYEMFLAFQETIQQEVVRYIFRVQVMQIEENLYHPTAYHGADETASSTAPVIASAGSGVTAVAERSGTATSSARKVGRNDPCPCGSGKKYKKCCGKTA